MRDERTEMLTDEEIEAYIRETFEENYERLRLEGGHPLGPFIKEKALEQVILYWRKLSSIAERVTDTEVKLTLPEQETPEGRKYTIEGVVDIVREDGKTVMYDIKTHEADFVRANIDLYEKQLNVYAYIWQELRCQPLNEAAIIATAFPESLSEAMAAGDDRRIEKELAEWQPVVEIALDRERVNDTITDFGEVVDSIENKRFSPPPLRRLKEKSKGTRALFATRVCRNCDARFSCRSYRKYARAAAGKAESVIRKYYNDYGGERERTEWAVSTLDAAAKP